MQLSPAAARPAALLGIPLALTEQLQPRAVHQEVHRPLRDHLRLLACEAVAAPGQGGMVGDGEVEPEQPQHAGDEALGLAPSAWRRARWKTSRSISTVPIATSEWTGWPPGVLRRGACHPAMAVSSNHSVNSPRRLSPAS